MAFPELFSWFIIVVVWGMVVGGILYILVKIFRPDWLVIDDDPEETPAITSSPAVSKPRITPIAPPATVLQQTTATPIAKPYNDCNDPLHIVERTTIATLAKLIIESQRKSFHDGKVPETRSLELLFGVSRSSEKDSEYQRLRLLLKDELARLDPPPAQPAYRPLDAQRRPVLTDEPVETA